MPTDNYYDTTIQMLENDMVLTLCVLPLDWSKGILYNILNQSENI